MNQRIVSGKGSLIINTGRCWLNQDLKRCLANALVSYFGITGFERVAVNVFYGLIKSAQLQVYTNYRILCYVAKCPE